MTTTAARPSQLVDHRAQDLRKQRAGIVQGHADGDPGSVRAQYLGVSEQPCIPANQQARLYRLCWSTLGAAVARPRTPYKVVLYANATAKDTARCLAAAETYAHDCGWLVVGRFVDVAADAQPWARDGWLQVLRRLRGGFAQGVVTDDRSAVSAADEPYEQTLHWLVDHFSFVAHARSSTVAPAGAR